MPNGFIAVADLGVQHQNPADYSRFQKTADSIHFTSMMFHVHPCAAIRCHLEPADSLSGYAVGKPEVYPGVEAKVAGYRESNVGKDLAIQRSGPHSM